VLERIALHQTRLRTPGLGLDAKGIALGAKGLVLLPTLDRLVGWLSVYTRERSLEDLLGSLELRFVRSAMGTREITVSFAAESSDRLDRIAETARLVGGFTFTGTSRHFVQYRDAAAPFGYDAGELVSTDASLALYHDRFSQTYNEEKAVELATLLLRLMPQLDPSTVHEPGMRYVVAEEGLGPALLHYLVRSRVDGEVTMAEWPPPTAFEDTPTRRYVVRIPELPPRMRNLMRSTPGITTFLPAGPGVAVEVGFHHPVQLRACPVFDPHGLVLVRGRGDEPWIIPRLPPMGDLRSFAQVELRDESMKSVSVATSVADPVPVKVPLRLVPSSAPWRNVTATWIPTDKLPLLRRLAYALPRQTLTETRIALTNRGAFLRSPNGIEAVPLGTFFVEVFPGLFTPAGFDVIPAVAPEVLYRALRPAGGNILFITQAQAALAVPDSAFVPLDAALLEADPWEEVVVTAIESALAEAPIELKLSPVGLFPLSGVEPVEDAARPEDPSVTP
jgi:hypothetical protein